MFHYKYFKSPTFSERKYLKRKLNKKKAIKTLLLDQSIITGIGNIYADEVLFAARINPLKKGKEISLDECQRIKEVSKEIIEEAPTVERPRGEWISVEDRLPEEGQYIVTTKFGIKISSFSNNLYKIDKYDFEEHLRCVFESAGDIAV